MAEFKSYKENEVYYALAHNKRSLPSGKASSSGSINPELSSQNYSLISRGNVKETQAYRKGLESEAFHYNRKDLVHAVEIVVQCPVDCKDEKKFFQESLNYIISTLPMGEKCVLSADVHMDEKYYSPAGKMISKNHMHVVFSPIVKDMKHKGYDWRLAAHDLTNRNKLKAFHPNFQKYLDGHGVKATVYGSKSSNGKTIGLTGRQLKEITAKTGLVLDRSLTVDQFCDLIRGHDIGQKSSFDEEFEANWSNEVVVDRDEDILI